METTNFRHYKNVVITAGGCAADGGQLFGLFSSVEDAVSIDADRLALAIVGKSDLSACQVEMAERNTSALAGLTADWNL